MIIKQTKKGHDNSPKRETKSYEVFIGEYYMLTWPGKALWKTWLFMWLKHYRYGPAGKYVYWEDIQKEISRKHIGGKRQAISEDIRPLS